MKKDKFKAAKVFACWKAYVLFVRRARLLGKQIQSKQDSKLKQSAVTRWVSGVIQNQKVRVTEDRKCFKVKT